MAFQHFKAVNSYMYICIYLHDYKCKILKVIVDKFKWF